LDARWDGHARRFNERFEREGLPLRVAHLSSIWTVTYTQPSRYNWMLQYLLRAQGVALSWVGTGRLIFSLNYTDHDVEEVLERFVAAARQMVDEGWWWHDGQQTDRAIKRHLLREMFSRRR
jgi:glutamate-1-semialdehyde 2,1-aminomutase